VVDLSVRVGPLLLRNPILSASGTYGHGLEMCHFTPPELLGGWLSKTVTPRPRPGNDPPRLCETEAGLLNSIGLENKGIDHYVREVLPAMSRADTVVITNIGGEAVEDFVELARRLDAEEAVDALEVNLSCPNVQGGKLPFATEPGNAAEVVGEVRSVTKKPLFAKLSPNVAHIGRIARAVEEAGADGVTAVNTLLGLALDWRSGKPGLATVQGGYSGPGMKPVALRAAWECARSVSIPVIGCGGISTARDALEYLVAGCSAVEIGTACFADPALPGRVVEEMRALLDQEGVERVERLIGTIRDGREPRRHDSHDPSGGRPTSRTR